MGQEPDAIRQQIEETREQMSETVGAIGYKADVKSRAKESVSDKTDALRSKITGATSRARDAAPDSGQVREGASQAVGVAQENPLGLAFGAVAVGFLAGMLVPSTRVEREKIGPAADAVRDKATDTAQEALDRGKQVAQDAAEAAIETAKEKGQEHGEELRSSAQQNAEDAAQAARP